ncbi:MAG: Tex family protein, partial [Gammaproteobacteria bacterium]|nr:Tex family protein [Gammaproteobacteria bacterium]
MTPIFARIAEEISASVRQVEAAASLLDEGATVPFIARYRKEVTGGLDDTQLRVLSERLIYLRELEERRAAVLKSIAEQDKLTPELEQSIKEADTKTRLEDLYLPYKPRRRTKAQIAREAGIEPLLDAIMANPNLTPQDEAAAYVNEEAGFADAGAVLEGAKQILMERFSEHAELLAELRDLLWRKGELKSQVMFGKEQEAAKFQDYFEFAEPIHKVPSHRALALFRGRNESLLMLSLALSEDDLPMAEGRIAKAFDIENKARAADPWLAQSVTWGWKVKLAIKIELDLFNQLREAAEEEAIRVFGANLKDLLLAAPAGPRATIGLDPGLRTGVKVAVVDATGKVLDTGAIYPHAPQNKWDQSVAVIAALAQRHNAELIAIGNGTASRETDKLAAEVIKKYPALKLSKVVVSEAGASVYSASELAAKEFPDMDVSLRGAVSIARRLQDPLAELVKIEPKSIGVGQYQHDVSQTKLARQLEGVVEDCVNAVGVDLNMASVPLLARVAGLNESVAMQIVMQRDSAGAFQSRDALKAVPRLGDKTFEQCAGFLRINGG